MELVAEMRHIAVERNEPYGIWQGNRYIIALYIAQNDYISAKKYIQEAIRIYETTDDPLILRQSGYYPDQLPQGQAGGVRAQDKGL